MKNTIFLITHSADGGVQEIWADLASSFESPGSDGNLFALYPSSDLNNNGRSWNYVLPKKPAGLIGWIAAFFRLRRFLTYRSPKFILTAMPAANIMTALAAASLRAPINCIISHHTPVYTYHGALRSLDTIVGSLPVVKSIISVSNTVSKSLDLKPGVYKRKRLTIKNALPKIVENELAALRRAREFAPAVRRRVVALGRLADQKNYPTLILAASHLDQVEIIIIGSGPDESKLKQLAIDCKVSDKVIFAGHLPRESAMKVLATAQIFVQPSIFEGHSLALIEASKIGLPLVVSSAEVQVEGITDSGGHLCGIQVPTMDAKELAREISLLLDNESYRAFWSRKSMALGEQSSFHDTVEMYKSLLIGINGAMS